jgi:hypothetical protein
MKFCRYCGTEWKDLSQPSPKKECEKCGKDLHICLNCRFYDIYKPNSCQNDTDPVLDKEKANFCDEFEFKNQSEFKQTKKPASDAKSNFERLFKKQQKN